MERNHGMAGIDYVCVGGKRESEKKKRLRSELLSSFFPPSGLDAVQIIILPLFGKKKTL